MGTIHGTDNEGGMTSATECTIIEESDDETSEGYITNGELQDHQDGIEGIVDKRSKTWGLTRSTEAVVNMLAGNGVTSVHRYPSNCRVPI